MGSYTDACLVAFQDATGIKPADGETSRAIRDLQAKCFEAIRFMELEHSGIRGGDGGWHGSDVVGHICRELVEASELVMHGKERAEEIKMARESQHAAAFAEWIEQRKAA